MTDAPSSDAPSSDALLILFVHGFPHAGRFWSPVVQALARRPEAAGWRVVAPDLRGFGSAPPAPPLTLEQFADDLAGVLDGLGVRRAVVCGLSMGGYVALALWRRHPERVRALVLADTRAGADDEAQRARRVALAETARREGAAAVAESQLAGALGRTTREGDPARAEALRALMAAASVEGIVGALDAMRARPDSTPILPTISVPTLVIVGAEDVLTPPKEARALAAAIPGAALVELPAAGHVSAWERPEAFADALVGFVAGLPDL
jgi:pimeloyl-ACP methyl ester carboxylesterase